MTQWRWSSRAAQPGSQALMLRAPLEAAIMDYHWLLGHVASCFGQEDPVQAKLQLSFGQ